MRCGIYVRVSTDEQRDNGYSIDSQLRMIKEYCEKNEYDIVDVYNDAGHSGKDLMRPEMQRLLKDIEKAIEKLKLQEKKLVDLYLSSSINVDAINHKNDMIKKEIENLNKKLKELNPDTDYKEYTIELSKKLEFDISIDENIFKINKIDFSSFWNDLDKKDKKEIIQKLIASMEIKRYENYEIEITNIKFTEDFISKNTKEYLKYLNDILTKNEVT